MFTVSNGVQVLPTLVHRYKQALGVKQDTAPFWESVHCACKRVIKVSIPYIYIYIYIYLLSIDLSAILSLSLFLNMTVRVQGAWGVTHEAIRRMNTAMGPTSSGTINLIFVALLLLVVLLSRSVS